MAATKRQMTWNPVTFTPQGGSLSTATGVTSVKVATGGNLLKFSGDADGGPTLILNDFNEPVVTVTSADLAWLLALVPGTLGSFAGTHKDALAATGGAIVYTLNPCVAESPSVGGEHRQIGSGDVNLVGLFSGPTTNPLSYSRS